MTWRHLSLLFLVMVAGACSKQPTYGSPPSRDSAKSKPADRAQDPGQAPTDGGRRVP
jgi:hypothetical protein